MELQIHIKENKLRILSRYFLHCHPARIGKTVVGKTYDCIVDKYGKIGRVKCVRHFDVQKGTINPSMIMLSDAFDDMQLYYNGFTIGHLEFIHFSILHFTERDPVAFARLIKDESRKLGIEMDAQQLNIF